MATSICRHALAVALLVIGMTHPASAALFAPPTLLAPAADPGSAPDHDITGLTIELTLDATHPTADSTHLAYDVALVDDGSPTTWEIVGFTVIRAWNEVSAAGSPDSPATWDGVLAPHFADWSATGVGITEGDHLGGFGYTVAGTATPDQLYLYFVTKNGADAFPVISSDLPVLASTVVAVPEPASAALLLGAGTLLLAVRRRG